MKKMFLLLMLIVCGATFAQSVYVGPIVGYNKGNNQDPTATISGAIRLKILSYGVEASVGYTSSKFTGGNIDATNYPIMLTLMMHPLPILYTQAGIGWYNTKLEFSGPLKTLGLTDESKSKLGYHVGFGAEIPIGNVLLTGDLKYVFLDYGIGALTGLANSNANYTLISAGLLFKL